MANFVLPLDTPDASLQLVGGKANNLNQLLRAGFPVPTGFIVTTSAYEAFIQENNLERMIYNALESLNDEQFLSYQSASQVIRNAFVRSEIPNGIVDEVCSTYRTSGAGAVAVRSSATTEDLPEASFAGLQETYLNVCSEAELLDAVRRCWSSLWTERAMAYRDQQKISHIGARLAVVIQQMVPAETAGVMFTVHPLTNNPQQVIINAVRGLGEALVSGRTTPDTVLIDKTSHQVILMERGDQQVMTIPAAGGTVEVNVDPSTGSQPALSSSQAIELARCGEAIESYFKLPQDIEWAIAGEKLYILQARPVTHKIVPETQKITGAPLSPGNDDWPVDDECSPQPYDLWTRSNLGENFPDPLVPLCWSALPHSFKCMLLGSLPGKPNDTFLQSVQWAKRFYGRLYLNAGGVFYVWRYLYGMPSSFLQQLLGSGLGEFYKFKVKANPFTYLRKLPTLINDSLVQDIGSDLQKFYVNVDEWSADFKRMDFSSMSEAELWRLEKSILERFNESVVFFCRAFNQANSSVVWLDNFLRLNGFNQPGLIHELTTALEGIFTAQMGHALWDIAEKIRSLGLESLVRSKTPCDALSELQERPEAQPVYKQFMIFLERYGHRCMNEYEKQRPRWIESPEEVIKLLIGYVSSMESVSPVAIAKQHREQRENTTAMIETHLDPLRRAIFDKLLNRTHSSIRQRDNSRHYTMKIMYIRRLVINELGRRWSQKGWIKQADDIYFLLDHEVGRVIEKGDPVNANLDLAKIITDRIQTCNFWKNISEPELIDAQGQPFVTTELQAQNILTGIPVSRGKARGPARLILNPDQANLLKQGDILVTRATDPGWAAIFPVVSGLVLEIGGQLSHGAIVAREYGLPAVANVRSATQLIHDGQMIQVDGNSGQVALE